MRKHRTSDELRIMYRLAMRCICVLEERLQAARDVNFELRKDLTALEARVCKTADCPEIKALERRLRHLLESEFVRQFDEVDPRTHEYIRDIRDADGMTEPKVKVEIGIDAKSILIYGRSMGQLNAAITVIEKWTKAQAEDMGRHVNALV